MNYNIRSLATTNEEVGGKRFCAILTHKKINNNNNNNNNKVNKYPFFKVK